MNKPPPDLSKRVFNIPNSVIILGLALVFAYIIINNLGSEQIDDVIFLLTFIPLRYGSPETSPKVEAFDGMLSQYDGLLVAMSDVWTFVTYVFVHGDSVHLIVNLLWLVIFGSSIAWRFGTARFYLFSAVCAAAGAALHLLTHFDEFSPALGASAAISGQMAGAIRFVFVKGGPLGIIRGFEYSRYFVPAISLREVFSDSQTLMFLAIWFILNLIIGFTDGALMGVDGRIGWQAHIGGFFAGLVLFGYFDPVKVNRLQDGRG